MKPRARYSWQKNQWDGVWLSPEVSARLSVLDTVGRDRVIASIVAGLHAKQSTTWRRTARFRAKRV